ncbi:DUF4332 domain-containing protein [Legionella cardiaca]|uniref:DUF4332 domain-containing protein n=1 Tax=Legionella cardiaca TaxID=1071983 RepID=A0ABY8AUV3_9GAMM|nr:DUF4332 domain-containing protein [Legionella cardiaca]WED42942.1 DUF4332 domain-containing protein [Legionella cardiaca]
MLYKLIDIEGIGERYATMLLEKAGIENQKQLLEACGHRHDRESLAAETGISYYLLLKWANRADLGRIKGIGEEYADLLERCGVNSVSELAQRNATHLHQALKDNNEQRHLVHKQPSLSQVESWVKEAKKLPRAVFH